MTNGESERNNNGAGGGGGGNFETFGGHRHRLKRSASKSANAEINALTASLAY